MTLKIIYMAVKWHSDLWQHLSQVLGRRRVIYTVLPAILPYITKFEYLDNVGSNVVQPIISIIMMEKCKQALK